MDNKYLTPKVVYRADAALFTVKETNFALLETTFKERYRNHPREHFNVGSTLHLGQYDVATSHNVKATLKQRCVHKRWNLQR